MKANRLTISLTDTNKAILNKSSIKFGLSKSDILNYLLKYTHYPKHSASASNIHKYNLEFTKFNNLVNKIHLDYLGTSENYNQIAKALNALVKYRSDKDKVFFTAQMVNRQLIHFKKCHQKFKSIYELISSLRKEVNVYDS